MLHKTNVLRDADVLYAGLESCVVRTGGLAPPILRYETMVLCGGRGEPRPSSPRQDLIPIAG